MWPLRAARNDHSEKASRCVVAEHLADTIDRRVGSIDFLVYGHLLSFPVVILIRIFDCSIVSYPNEKYGRVVDRGGIRKRDRREEPSLSILGGLALDKGVLRVGTHCYQVGV